MRFESNGLSLWVETPRPGEVVQDGTAVVVTVAMAPADLGNNVEVRFRVNGGPAQLRPMTWLWSDPIGRSQQFTARLGAFRDGDLVEFTPIGRCLDRQVPAPEEVAGFAVSFRVQAAGITEAPSATATPAAQPAAATELPPGPEPPDVLAVPAQTSRATAAASVSSGITVYRGPRTPRFELLVVGQDIPTSYDFARLTRDLDDRLRYGISGRFATTMYVDFTPRDFGLVATPPGMTVDRAKVRAYLKGVALPAAGDNAPLSRWSLEGRTPTGGLLVLVLGAPPATQLPRADAYSIDRSDGLPPMVTVHLGHEPVRPNAGTDPYGRLWHNTVRRAVAQQRFALFDEYEYPGPEWTKPPAGWTGAFNNVLFIDDAQRTLLQGATPPRFGDVVGDRAPMWPLDKDDEVEFTPHAGPDTQVSTAGALAGRWNNDPFQEVALHEGAGGYRTYAVRAAADCLMRRMPGSAVLPVQDEVDFCPVCEHLMNYALEKGERRGLTRPTVLANQRVQFNKLNWPSAPTRLTGAAVRAFRVTEAASSASPPTWSATVAVNAAPAGDLPAGLVLTDVDLLDRDDDPFVNSPRVFSRLAFEKLTVKLAGDAAETELSVAQALIGSGELEPELLVQRDAGGFEAQLGYRLTLRWNLPSGWRIEAVQSCVLMRRANNVDPGGAVFGCKAYPQVALRVLRQPEHVGELPTVQELGATIHWRLNNFIDNKDHAAMEAMLPKDFTHGARMTNAIDASLFTDGNDVHGDAVYDTVSTVIPFPSPVPYLPPLAPAFAMRWKAFRRIAGVQEFDSRIMAIMASSAYIAHAGFEGTWGLSPVLPFWSWLFDYADPLCTPKPGDSTTFVGAYALGEATRGGRASDASAVVAIDWPLGSAFRDLKSRPVVPQPVLRHLRLPRQGTWDNIHVTAPMGKDNLGREIVSAPVCADKCFHLHWRWGVDGVRAISQWVPQPERYLGWSTRGPIRSGVDLGAPLIPPNQHLDVTVSRVSDAELDIRYRVLARNPGEGQWQVLCEQGGGFAYSYQGLPTPGFIGIATAVLPGVQLTDTPAERRKLFMRIYARLRWFDPALDGAVPNDIQQIPDRGRLPAAKWAELRDA